jgi:hypothetical protein
VSILNARGLIGGWRKPFTGASLTALCKAHGIPTLRERLRAQACSPSKTAHQTGVSTDTVATWHRLDLITAVPVEHHGVRDAAGQRTPTSAQIVAAGRAPATAPPGQPPEQQP